MVTVYNMKDTGNQLPPSGFASWQDWWEKRKGKKFNLCSNTECKNHAEVGAHVKQRSLMHINVSFIVPLCKQCNGIPSEKSFEVLYEDLLEIIN